MINKVRKYPLASVLVLAFYYGVGVVGLTLDGTQSLFRALVPFTLLISLYFLWLFEEALSFRLYMAALALFVFGFAIEVAGVNTGVIFGEYIYGKTLGVKLLGTPLMIGVNWLILIYSGWVLTGLFSRNRWIRSAVGSALMVIYDIALEPVAIRLDMWNWHGESVPLQNYLAWFIISFVFFMMLSLNVKDARNKIAAGLFIIQFVFFVILNLIFRPT
jgi:uncharacterized membrane protein